MYRGSDIRRVGSTTEQPADGGVNEQGVRASNSDAHTQKGANSMTAIIIPHSSTEPQVTPTLDELQAQLEEIIGECTLRYRNDYPQPAITALITVRDVAEIQLRALIAIDQRLRVLEEARESTSGEVL